MQIPLDYAIVGGGVAGTYCAWRLKKQHPRKNIVLFEYSDRIGGRLLTSIFPGSKIKIELGGMRYNPKQHRIFSELVDEFKLQSERFPMGYDNFKDERDKRNDPKGDNNYAYFRGTHLRIGDFSDSSKVPFKVDLSERNKSPDDLQCQVVKTLVPDSENLSNLSQWFDVKVFGKNGDYLWKYGFWNLLYRVLSPEAYLFLKYGSGYDTNVSNGNAVTLLPTGGDYSPENEFLTLKEGMMSLPLRLCKEFEDLGGKVVYQRRLDSIERDGKRHYRLSFAKTKTSAKEKEKTADTGVFEVDVAKNVILAMPKGALERIRWKPLQEDKKLRGKLDSVLSQEAIKIFLQYDRAWWKSLGLFRGRSITDLPIRQTFYFSDLDDVNETDPFKISEKPAALMASYSDIESVPFWRGLEGAEDEKPFPGPDEGYRASELMVQEAHQQVKDIHNQPDLPQPSAAAYYDWADMPYGAAWHCWKAGYRYDKIIDEMRHPLKQEKIYICGEAYSANQGWAEGALETAEGLLTGDLDPEDKLESILSKPGEQRGLRSGVPEEYRRKDAKGRYY